MLIRIFRASTKVVQAHGENTPELWTMYFLGEMGIIEERGQRNHDTVHSNFYNDFAFNDVVVSG